jgi:aminopeptidase N
MVRLPPGHDGHRLEARGRNRYPADGMGLRRVVDERDGCRYVFMANYPDQAPRVMCCSEDPGQRVAAAITLYLPEEWIGISHTPAEVRPSTSQTWLFPSTSPVSPNLLGLAAGPWRLSEHAVAAETLGGRVGVDVHVPASRVNSTGSGLADMAVAAIGACEKILQTPYPHATCTLVFVPAFPILGLSSRGLILFDADVLERMGSDERYAMSVLTHEVGHTWIGGEIDFAGRHANRLVEGLNTYLAREAMQLLDPLSDPWSADQTLPDSGYAKWADRFRSIQAEVGRSTLLLAVQTLLRADASLVTEDALLTICNACRS